MTFQAEKALVSEHYAALAKAGAADVAATLAKRTSDDWLWRGVHPFHEQTGAADVAATFWTPFLTAMSRVQRRQDIFIAGHNGLDAAHGTWVISMGHLMALFDKPFLGIPPTRKIAMLRYAEFNRVADGKIVETAFFCDLIHLMHQAGLNPLPPQTGAHLVQPGPATHDGLLFGDSDPAEGAKTLDLIERMIRDIGRNSNTGEGSTPYDATPQDELSRCWHDDMLWWGPDGIGATYTIDRYIEQHQRPFRTHLSNRTFNGHVCRLGEGNFGGFFGWPNLTMTPVGGYMGLPAGPPADMRVVDMYRRDGDKLAENWIFIDMLHFLNMQGLDVLGRMAALAVR
ncbi:ester cyclase [Jannaschia sp. M317]|uniref:ester cyclase n=1 Tax=Jannaschia sp. M317 TaxID=2867011 RepID=UPI0021A91A29|nr:ester cyclase [Jannaschia sp. M317]UWQ16842.1 ester cyclase [Jannaschia sp. M317]